MTKLSTLYETDYATWAKRNAELLRRGHFAELDVEHLLQELGDMSKSERRELESRLLILLAHLLKWQYQYQRLSERWREFDGRSWRATITEQRKQLSVLFRQAPGLKAGLADALAAAYADAIELAADETGLPLSTFPASCPYSAEQMLEKTFFPDSVDRT
jgi:hypothetical protein